MTVLDDLRALASNLERGPRRAQFVANELRLVEQGCSRASAGADQGDLLAATTWKRLALEATMRVCWIAGDELVADDRGELLLEPTRVRERCDRLAARDLLNLKTAYKAISEANSGEPDRQLLEEVADLAASRSASPAPRFLKDFAVNQTQRALYAQHRLCSAVMHPGELATDQGAMILATRLIDEVAVLAVAFSRPIGRILVEEPFWNPKQWQARRPCSAMTG